MPINMKWLAELAEAVDDLAPSDERSFADVDDSSADSFPASDPPAWASMRVGAPSISVA
jgi:hypothetical protein